MGNGVDRATLCNRTFVSQDTFFSDVLTVSAQFTNTVIFIAPAGVNVNVTPQVRDPLGTWHTVDGEVMVLSGHCDALPFPFNPGQLRLQVTPYSSTGSCIIWAIASGG